MSTTEARAPGEDVEARLVKRAARLSAFKAWRKALGDADVLMCNAEDVDYLLAVVERGVCEMKEAMAGFFRANAPAPAPGEDVEGRKPPVWMLSMDEPPETYEKYAIAALDHDAVTGPGRAIIMGYEDFRDLSRKLDMSTEARAPGEDVEVAIAALDRLESTAINADYADERQVQKDALTVDATLRDLSRKLDYWKRENEKGLETLREMNRISLDQQGEIHRGEQFVTGSAMSPRPQEPATEGEEGT